MANGNHDDKRFIVHNRKEVVQILRDLAEQKMMLNTVWNHGKDRTLTSVIDVDYDHGAAYLDITANSTVNESLLASQETVFTSTSGLKIQWSSSSISIETLKDGKAFKIALPDDLVRVQRREFYRLPIPAVTAVLCSIPVEDKTVKAALVDLSVGGIGATVTDRAELPLADNAELHHCKIDFPGVGMAELTLCIRQMVKTALSNDTIAHKIGMEFINPSRGNQALIQRYINKLEREFMGLAANR